MAKGRKATKDEKQNYRKQALYNVMPLTLLILASIILMGAMRTVSLVRDGISTVRYLVTYADGTEAEMDKNMAEVEVQMAAGNVTMEKIKTTSDEVGEGYITAHHANVLQGIWPFSKWFLLPRAFALLLSFSMLGTGFAPEIIYQILFLVFWMIVALIVLIVITVKVKAVNDELESGVSKKKITKEQRDVLNGMRSLSPLGLAYMAVFVITFALAAGSSNPAGWVLGGGIVVLVCDLVRFKKAFKKHIKSLPHLEEVKTAKDEAEKAERNLLVRMKVAIFGYSRPKR